MPLKKYGLQWPDNLDPRLIDLAMYSSDVLRARGRPLSKWEHLRLCMKAFLPDRVFCWHRWVDMFGEAWCEHSGIAVWGAGGTTKSGILGALSLFDLLAEPKQTLNVMITNPQEKHWDRCFSKLLLWRSHMPEQFKIGRLVKSPKPALSTLEAEDGSRRGILCISIEPGETADHVSKKVGAHAPRTRLCLDEGQGLPEAAINIGVNLFIGSKDAKAVVIGNPTIWNNNALGAASLPMDGDTAKIDKDQPDEWFSKWTWDDRLGKVIVFDGTRCPTFDSPEESKRLFMMIQPKDVIARQNMPGGDKSLLFWQQVKGRIAPAGQCVTLYNDIDWDSIGLSMTHEWTGPFDQQVGCDLSLGGDKIPVYRFGIGQAGPMGKVMQKLERRYITVDVTKPDRSGQIAVAFKKIVKEEWGLKLSQCALECSGQQGAIADRIEKECNGDTGNERVYRIRTEEAITNRVLSNGRVHQEEGETNKGTRKETAKDRYQDRATEVIMNLVELFEARLLWGLDAEVKTQLCTRGYDQKSLEAGATKAQKKKEWRDQHGDVSPDELDAVACAVAKVLEQRIIVPGQRVTMEDKKFQGLPAFQQPRAKSNNTLRTSVSRVSVAMRRTR